MSTAILIERQERIALEEWRALVAADQDLRLRSQAFVAVNPRTGAQVQLPPAEADSEIKEGDKWLPFLRWRRGCLVTEYRAEFESPQHPSRIKLVQVAQRLRARLGTDAGEEELGW